MPLWSNRETHAEVSGFFEKRFGIPSEWFQPYAIGRKGPTYFMIRRSPHLEQALGLRIDVPGLPILRSICDYLKPTGAILQLASHLVHKNVLDLSERQLSRLIGEGHMVNASGLEEGYVMIRADGVAAGCGLAIGERVIGQFPKWFRAMYRKKTESHIPE